jgi:hypothetical protein
VHDLPLELQLDRRRVVEQRLLVVRSPRITDRDD